MNRKRMTNKWFNLALGIVVLFVALSNGVDILGSNASWGRNSWGIGWTVGEFVLGRFGFRKACT